MKWKRAYEVFLVVGILLVIVSLFFALQGFLLLAIPGALIILLCLIELLLLARSEKQTKEPEQPTPRIIQPAKMQEAIKEPERPKNVQTTASQEKHPSFLKRILSVFFKEKIVAEKEGIKVIEREEEEKITLLRRYIAESLSASYPRDQILASALKSRWPEKMVDQILDECITKKVKKKLVILSASLGGVFLVMIVLALNGLFLLPYWIKAARLSPVPFYTGVMFFITAGALFFYTRLRKTLKRKNIEYRIEESAHVEEIKETLKKFEGGYETDIDKFYSLIAEKKRLTLAEVAKAFDINKETAEEWAKILLDQNLVDIHYPTVGEPEVIWKSSKATK